MKQYLLILLIFSFGSTGAQTKKVYLEDYTGIHCGACPSGTLLIEDLQTSYPANFVPVAMHTGPYEPNNSPLNAGPIGSVLTIATGVSGYPTGSVDRKKYGSNTTIAMDRADWTNAFTDRRDAGAIVSVSFDNMIGTGNGGYEADININFTSPPATGVPVKMNVYIVEDSILATGPLGQSNYSPDIQGGASPLNPWFHNRTFRKAVSGDAWGFNDAVPAVPVVGTTYTKHISFTVSPSWVTKQMHAVAYVAYDGNASADKKEILNTEEAPLSAFTTTSIKENHTVGMLNIYPNPAAQLDVIRVAYRTPQNGNVVMKLFNAIGQLVGVPYNSIEVAGVHTIQWRPADYNLNPGIYIMQLSNAGGTSLQKISIH